MRMETMNTEDYIKEEEEKAKNRLGILGTHSAPTKAKAVAPKAKGKSGRIKTFYFKKDLKSFKMFLDHEITFDEMKEMQSMGM